MLGDKPPKEDEKKGINPWNRVFIAAVIIGTSVILLSIILYANMGANDELGDITSKLTNTESHTIVFENGTQITPTNYVTPPETLTQILKDLTQTRKDSNQQMLTTLMTAISAWIGAIIAFYFGKDYLVKLAESNESLIVANTKLASNAGGKPKIETINDLLTQKPDSGNVVSYELGTNQTPGKKQELTNKYKKELPETLIEYGSTFIFTKDEDGKYVSPYGMLYKSGWEDANHTLDHVTLIEKTNKFYKKELETINEKISALEKDPTITTDTLKKKELATMIKDKESVKDGMNKLDAEIKSIAKRIGITVPLLKSLIEKIVSTSEDETVLNLVHDKITKNLWSDQYGFKNFQRANPSDTIKEKLQTMKDTFKDPKTLGNILVIVFSDDDKLRGILGYSDLANASETSS